jgi:hypothetical protein
MIATSTLFAGTIFLLIESVVSLQWQAKCDSSMSKLYLNPFGSMIWLNLRGKEPWKVWYSLQGPVPMAVLNVHIWSAMMPQAPQQWQKRSLVVLVPCIYNFVVMHRGLRYRRYFFSFWWWGLFRRGLGIVNHSSRSCWQQPKKMTDLWLLPDPISRMNVIIWCHTWCSRLAELAWSTGVAATFLSWLMSCAWYHIVLDAKIGCFSAANRNLGLWVGALGLYVLEDASYNHF